MQFPITKKPLPTGLPRANVLTRERPVQALPPRQTTPKTKLEAAVVPWRGSHAALDLRAVGIMDHGRYGELIVEVVCEGMIVADVALRARAEFYNLFPVWIRVPEGPPETSGYVRVRYRTGARHAGLVAGERVLESLAPRFKSSVEALRLGLVRPKSEGVAIPGSHQPVGFIHDEKETCRCLPMVAGLKRMAGGKSILHVDWYADFREGIRGALHHVASSRMSLRSAQCLALRSQLFAKIALPGGGWFPILLMMEDEVSNRKRYWNLVASRNAFPAELKSILSCGCRLWEMDLCKDPDQVILKSKGDSLAVVQRPGIGGKLYPATTPSFLRVSNLTL
jgi:hypothetical protein